MKFEFIIGAAIVAAITACAILYPVLRIPRETVISMPANRRALLYRVSPAPGPTLIVLHSYSGDASSTAKYSGFLQAAIPRRFNVVVPEAANQEWHDSPEAQTSESNDVGFIASLVEKLVTDAIADPRRIFIAGISNGGMMAFAVACARPDLFAGIGTISGGMPQHVFENCRLTKAMPLVMINGDADDVLPYRGGDIGARGDFFRRTAGVEETAALFAASNGCTSGNEPTRTRTRDGSRNLDLIEWECPPSGSVTLIKVVGGSHEVIGWRAPWQALLGWPPDGAATAAAIVDRFAEISSRLESSSGNHGRSRPP